MMDHAERHDLARDFAARMAAAYPILVGGVYGSTARQEDTPFSDLEMLFVVPDGCPARGKHLVFRQTAVGYRVYSESALVEILTRPDGRWPFHMGMLEALQVLQGDPELVKKWLARGNITPPARFKAYLEAHLPGLVLESYGRIRSSALRQDWETARYALQEVLFEMLTALCLLNRRWVHRDYDAGLLEAAGFEKLPEGYAVLVPQLLAADRFEALLPLVERLVSGFWALLEREGLGMRNYCLVEEIPL